MIVSNSLADFYSSKQGRPYKRPQGWCSAYTSLLVLQEIWGKPWNDLTLALVSGLNPRIIRVITAEETADAINGRVSVYVDERRIITSIRMEVSIDTPNLNGHELWDALNV